MFKILCVFLVFLSIQAHSVENALDVNSTIKSENLETNQSQKLDFSISSLYKNADIIVKIVICILAFFSLLTWAVFFAKILMFKSLFKGIKKDKIIIDKLDDFSNLTHFDDKSIAKELIEAIKDENSKSKGGNLAQRVKIRLDNKVGKYCIQVRSFNALLACISSSAPFIGLFGTVWGIMNAFIGIAQQESVSLAVVAPGIAEALFATAFGLAAAIPAVLFYNYLLRLSVNFAHKLDENATMLYVIADRIIFYKD